MIVALDARPCNDHFPGIARYIAGLLSGFAEAGRPVELAVLYDPRERTTRFDLPALVQAAGGRLVPVLAGPFAVAQQWAVPAALRRCRADLYHATYTMRPFGPLPCPSVTTVYDLIPQRFPHYYPPTTRLIIQMATRLLLRRSKHIIAISRATASDLSGYYPVDPRRVSVVHLAVEERFRPQEAAVITELRERLRLPKHYLLYLGSNKPHKNLEQVVKAWDRARGEGVARLATLVVAGPWDDRYGEARALAEARHLGPDAVRWIGPVADADLPALYSGALAFVFPSIYEGFGLPPLEAMACGTPVITSSTPALREVVGEAALIVDPHDEQQLAEAYLRVLRGQGFRDVLSAMGIRQAARFSWHRSAEETLTVYEGAVAVHE